MLALLRQAKVRKYRLDNLLLVETLVFLCIPAGQVKSIMRLIGLRQASPGRADVFSPRTLRRLERALMDWAPGLMGARARGHGPGLELELTWPDLAATLAIAPRAGELRVDMELCGRGPEVMEMAQEAQQL